MKRLQEQILKAKEILANKIDRKAVMKAVDKKAGQVFKDKKDDKKVKATVDKAISMAKDTEDAIGIGLGFFDAK